MTTDVMEAEVSLYNTESSDSLKKIISKNIYLDKQNNIYTLSMLAVFPSLVES